MRAKSRRPEGCSTATMSLGWDNRTEVQPTRPRRTAPQRTSDESSCPAIQVAHTESLCDLECLTDSAPEGPVLEHLTAPLLRFRAPSATSPTSAALPCERTAAHGLSQTLDGLSTRRLACLVSCRRHPWDSKRLGVNHLNCAFSQSSKEAHAKSSPG